MKCKLMGQSLRAFSKAIRLFSKISNEILIIANNNKIKLQSINENKTAFVEIEFENQFFSSYECSVETKCKLFMKSLILVFRVVNIDKIVKDCTLIMNDSMSRIVFQMDCGNGVNREYFLPYMESNHLRYSSDLSGNDSSFKVNSKLLFECLHNFSIETKDISIWLTSQQILFKSYFDDIEEQNIITSFSYKTREFQDYNITNEISVTFTLKDLKNFLEFALFNDQIINCYFEISGRPIEFIFNTNQYYSAKLMLATHDFPEDECPIPPSLPNQWSHQSHNSLMSSGNISFQCSAQQQNQSTIGVFPECILNTSVSNNDLNLSQNNNNNVNQTSSPIEDSNEDSDPFADEDDHIIEEMLSQLPDFSRDNFDDSVPNEIAALTESALREYHMSVLHPTDEDDYNSQQIINSQEILVPESDDE